MIVEQDEKNIRVTIIRTNREGKEQKTKYMYSLEGKKIKNKTDFGKQESTAKWLEKGLVLAIRSTMDVRWRDMEFTVESVQTWSMSEDRLVVESVRYMPRGDMETNAVYDRNSGSEND